MARFSFEVSVGSIAFYMRWLTTLEFLEVKTFGALVHVRQ